MTDVGRNETVRLEDDSQTGTFEGHSAFARVSRLWIDDEVPAAHLASHDASIKTLPTPFDRTNQDDVDRTQESLMITLAGEVDRHCTEVLLSSPAIAVDDVNVGDLDRWTRDALLEVRLATRSNCGVDVLLDTELAPFLRPGWDGDDAFVDLGWFHADLYGMNRHQPVESGLYAVVAQQHVVGLSSRASLFFTSHSLDRETEYLSARCDVPYRPRLDFHPGAVRVARATFASDDAWRAAARSLRR